jgi:hypothetical protein
VSSPIEGWYIIKDLHFCDDPFDEGHWEVSADFIDSGNLISKMVELTYKRIASREGYKWDEFLELLPDNWWKDIEPPSSHFAEALNLRVNLQLLKTGQRLKFGFSEYAPACMVIDTCTGNEAFLRPEQYFNPKFQLINWLVV